MKLFQNSGTDGAILKWRVKFKNIDPVRTEPNLLTSHRTKRLKEVVSVMSVVD